MIFWMGILAGALFTWWAVRMGFYETWALLFNTVISIYVAIFLAPVILDLVPAAGDTPYASALALTVTAAGTFLILHGITYVLFTSQFKISLPKIFDLLLAGLLGFLTGFLVLSFVALVITAMPISQSRLASEMGISRQSQQANVSYICWWCDVVNAIVSSSDTKVASGQALDLLLSRTQPKARDKRLERVDPNEPVGPEEAETNTPEESRPTPPSEPNRSPSELGP